MKSGKKVYQSKKKNKHTSLYCPDHSSYDPAERNISAERVYSEESGSEQKNNESHIKQRAASSKEKLKISWSDYFNNYELSWLQFNWRVFEEARNSLNPLLERVKFIGIMCRNLDEFFQKRVGGLKRQVLSGVNEPSIDGRTPKEQLTEIRQEVEKMITEYRSCFFDDLVPALEQEGLKFKAYTELSSKQKSVVDEYFEKQLYPILTPLIVDQSHPFPLISNKSLNFAVELYDPVTEEKLFARIKIPPNRPRWLLAEQKSDQSVFVSIDEVIRHHLERIFPGAEIISSHIFRVTRSADIERNEEEADDLLELIEEEISERRFAEIVRLEIEESMPDHVLQLLLERMEVNQPEIFLMKGEIGLSDAVQLYSVDGFDHLNFKQWLPSLHPAFRQDLDDDLPSVFDTIKQGDFLVHHPYQSFETSVQRFIQEAADDPDVLAIKQTMYRTSKDSPIMHSLMKAVETGKQVAVLVELKARFDEERNIEWAHKLEKAGVHVAYGLPGLKIHSKVTVVVRQEGDQLCNYVHLGTGNYHPDTAQLYEDIGLFTCENQIGADATELFNFLTGFAPDQTYSQLLVAPKFMRRELNKMIDFEIEQAKAGKESRIIAKMNSLEDPLIIQKLYEASRAGVMVDLIVRGVCRLKPGVEGMSSNIRVHSIIGRFLEHSRIWYFRHAEEDLYYIGSADWMRRNLDKRVESVVPIANPKLKQYLQFVINLYMRDNQQRWVLKSTGNYEKVRPSSNEPVIATHDVLMNHTDSGENPVPLSKGNY